MQVENLNNVIDQVSKDKGIDRSILVEAMEQAILTAAKKVFGYERELEAVYNEDLGQVELFQYMVVVDDVENPDTELSVEDAQRVDPDVQPGDELGFQIFYRPEDSEKAREEDEKYGDILKIRQARRTFGRIAAQTAKQVIIQRVREAERDIVFNEYKDRKHELVTGIARRFERGNIIVDLGRAEAVLTIREQMPRESYRAGDRVQAFVKDIDREAKGPLILLSRTDDGLVIKLFEMEVPEIYEGIVTIQRVAREPGERAKIAVISRDSDVDPVGACVGMKGSRVQAVVQELRGEKIDIVPWSPDVAKFVCNAIQPADVSRVLIDEDRNTIELIVPDDQLSLAIGRRGQNVRLASKLVGWKIEINSESKIEQSKKELWWYMVEEHGVDGSLLDYLFKLGYHSPENLLNADEEELMAIPGVSLDTAQRLQQLAYEVKKKKEDGSLGMPIDEEPDDEHPVYTAESVFGPSTSAKAKLAALAVPSPASDAEQLVDPGPVPTDDDSDELSFEQSIDPGPVPISDPGPVPRSEPTTEPSTEPSSDQTEETPDPAGGDEGSSPTGTL